MKRVFVILTIVVAVLGLAGGAYLLLVGSGDKGEIKEGLYYEASGISPDAILLTVNERDIPAERYFYWLNYNCDYAAEMLGGDPDWTAARPIPTTESTSLSSSTRENHNKHATPKSDSKEDQPEEQTLDDYVKQMALNNTSLYAVVEEWAEQYAVQLTAEDRTAMAAEYQARCDSYGGEHAYLKSLADQGVSPELAETYSKDYYLYKGLYKLFLQEESPLAPAEGAMEEFAQTQQLCTVDYIFISTADAAGDPSAMAQCWERAQMVLARLNAKTNPPADFYKALEAYSDRKDFPSSGFTFAPGESGMGEEFEAMAKTLGEWEYSQTVLEGPDGLYVLRGRKTDPNTLSAMYFDQLLSDAVAAANISVTRPYKKLTAQEFYTKMAEIRAGGGGGSASIASAA